jgi:hypothetical protein
VRVRVRVKKGTGIIPLTSVLSPGGERKITVRDLYRGMEGDFPLYEMALFIRRSTFDRLRATKQSQTNKTGRY